ncbi:protein of unknown function DUF6 transmembrane [Ancylobacter novellus DSM 506]|uniref:EamA domain-containing protein n=1 Tax=Ancylobacter novellus (strain ATCC 8093 / DSM 506 / JCM 20403 / CCM 1077 / IAM 12100 / NBRC 12443 / NCIMB 10456) TaxID=639283 RepID=D7A226_ANCN5|nr:protein of unknown function DUF6 transmembrane [Ancylobacter novellus DSM 506]
MSLRSLGSMLLLAVMWGLSIPVTKMGLETLPPLTLTALRFAVAVPLLFALLAGRWRLPWRAVPKVAALGFLAIGIGQVTQTLGVVGTSASVGTVITATIPLFIVVIAALRLRQPVTLLQTAGLIAAFAGIALVAFGDRDPAALAQTTASGAILMLLSAAAIAFYYVWSVEVADAYGTVTVVAWSTLCGFISLAPWAAWEASNTPFVIGVTAIGAAIYLGVVVTVAGLFLWLNMLRTVPARVAASVQFLQPVVGVMASAALFGDHLGLAFFVGVALVLTGLATTLANR